MAKKPRQAADQQPQLDPETVSTLLEMAAWWTEHRDVILQPLPLARPRFQRKDARKTRSIRLDKRMIKRAEAKAKKESARTGGTLNSLIEVLLWEYLGRPKELVESESTEPES